jgi:hypothetical protein
VRERERERLSLFFEAGGKPPEPPLGAGLAQRVEGRATVLGADIFSLAVPALPVRIRKVGLRPSDPILVQPLALSLIGSIVY